MTVAKIATGEITELVEDDRKEPAAKVLSIRADKARAQKLSLKRQAEIIKKLAAEW
jgi:hypothetical protein